MIWGVDASRLLVWIPIAASGFAAACGVGRAARVGIVAATLAAAVVWGVAGGADALPGIGGDMLGEWGAPSRGWPASGWGVIAGGIAVAAAALGPSRYATTIAVVLGTGVAIASQTRCPVGAVGLLHHVALVDLAGAVAATTALGALGWTWSGGQAAGGAAPRGTKGGVAGVAEPVGPARIGRRAGAMGALLTMAVALAIYQEEQVFGLPMVLGLWLGMSEVLAAGVAWQATSGLVALPAEVAVEKQGRRRLGLVVAGVFATVALVLMPVVIAAATAK